MRSSLLAVLLIACQPASQQQPVTVDRPDPSPDAGEGALSSDGTSGPNDRTVRSSKMLAKYVTEKDAKKKDAKKGTLSGSVGGLIGAKGTQIGAGGLGSRGAGLGGGGTAQGLGGLGTRGLGSGASGYGRGSGTLGSAAVHPPVQPASTETYTDYGVNKATLTEVDPLSTFSIDVDTASYAIARSHLDHGGLPPAAAVRVEEFVNAQTYSYVPPNGEGAFSVSMEASPDPWTANHHLLRVGVKAAEPKVDRLPVHLTFLVDTSCSMAAANKLPLAKAALTEMVKNLDGEDRVAIATYAGSTRVVLKPTRVSNRAQIFTALQGLSQGGGTNMDSGMQLAYDLALSSLEPGTENRVVVLSDGDANIGRTSHEQILASLTQYAKRGITLSTIGFGRGNYQDTMMEQLANKGDGNYYYIDSMKEARKVFGTQLTSTVQTVARDVKIQVDFDPESVLSYRLIGYENRDIADADFRNDAVDAGEIGSGHTVTALYDLVLRDHPSSSLATVRVRSKTPGPDAPAVERATNLPSIAVRTSFDTTTPDFRVAVATAAFAEKLRGSPYAEEIGYDRIARVLESADRGSDEELIGLVRKAGRLTAEPVARR